MNKSLYEQDVVLWSTEQADALRAAQTARLDTPSPIDWENVAEEIESLGRSERSALRSRIRAIVEHLLKLQASPAQSPRANWAATIRTQRSEIEGLLDDSPSLRREINAMIAWALPRACRDVAANMADNAQQPLTDLDQLSYTEAQVLGEWFPRQP